MQRSLPCGVALMLRMIIACGLVVSAGGVANHAYALPYGTTLEEASWRGMRSVPEDPAGPLHQVKDDDLVSRWDGIEGGDGVTLRPYRVQGRPKPDEAVHPIPTEKAHLLRMMLAFSPSAQQGMGQPGPAPGPPAKTPETLPPLPRAMRYIPGDTRGTPLPPAQPGTRGPTTRGAPPTPIVPDQDGSIMARVPEGPRQSFQGYKAAPGAASPAGSVNPIGEFVLDSFDSRATARKPEPTAPPPQQPEAKAPSLLEQIGMGIGKAVSNLFPGQ